jgi:acetyltransferase-like isoleucine patch superfamily enzyme
MRWASRTWRRVAARVVHAAWRWIQKAGTVTAETAAGGTFAAFGPGSLIAFPTGSIYGERWIEVGSGTMIGEQASICAGMGPGHDLGPDSVLRIGDRCVIGRGSHIVAHHSIDIGDDVFTGPYVYITDQNHSYADPDVPIGRQWPVNAAVSIGAGTWLGTGVIVLPGSVIGRNVVVAAGSVVRGEIGDRCVVAGAPARVVKDFSPETGWTRSLPRDGGPASETVPVLIETVPVPIEIVPIEPVRIEAELAEPGPADEPARRPLVTDLEF